ncbi:FlaD/FlaE family flagellar protein [Halorussus salinisoli]|uniref:FlaD/FlaE family flagellar protein n=1 Tax=Halorussus salinisoli TaxID=2558242 RepID=UPI002A916325|nr:FlaD/FlaE family flagellar protein [Halorussus salinisoli]
MKLIGLTDQFVHLLGTGLVGMGIMDFMDEEEGESVEADSGGGGDDDLFGDGMGDGAGGEMDGDFGGMDDGMDDGMGMDGEMDDWADGGGGGDAEFAMGGGSGPTQELENRIDELENEVAEISSTVGTVRSENEQISAKVDETEENVRKLLEIYEMVTRGVNPFVDDVQQGGVAGGDGFGAEGGGDFGLFEDDGEDEQNEDLNEDIADAEAESFFDDDFDEEEDGFEDDAAEDLGFDSPDEVEATDDEESTLEADDEDDGGQAGGSTFEELKEEYESGDADWAEEEGAPEGGQPEPEPTLEAETTPEESADGDFEFEGPSDTEPATPATQSGRGGKPYLAELPKGYVSDLVVMEWLEFLVTEFGSEDAVRTIQYYGDIDWISESVEEELLAFMSGFAGVDSVDTEKTGPAALEVDDHIQSLTFLSQLTGDAVQRKIVEHCAQIRGGRDGIQR